MINDSKAGTTHGRPLTFLHSRYLDAFARLGLAVRKCAESPMDDDFSQGLLAGAMTGIGDNFQLDTLLGDPLTGDPAHEARVHAVAAAVAPTAVGSPPPTATDGRGPPDAFSGGS